MTFARQGSEEARVAVEAGKMHMVFLGQEIEKDACGETGKASTEVQDVEAARVAGGESEKRGNPSEELD
jgi:hypothetical protein